MSEPFLQRLCSAEAAPTPDINCHTLLRAACPGANRTVLEDMTFDSQDVGPDLLRFPYITELEQCIGLCLNEPGCQSAAHGPGDMCRLKAVSTRTHMATAQPGTTLVDVSQCPGARPAPRGTCREPALDKRKDTDLGRLRDDSLFNPDSVLLDTPEACADLCLGFPSCIAATWKEQNAQCPDSGPEFCCPECPFIYYRCAGGCAHATLALTPYSVLI